MIGNECENRTGSVRDSVESNAKSNNATHPFADFKMVRKIVYDLGYAPVADGVSGMRKIQFDRDFLCMAFASKSKPTHYGDGRG